MLRASALRSSRPALLTATGALRLQCRCISRFEGKKPVGPSRARRSFPTNSSTYNSGTAADTARKLEEKPSEDDSQLWHTSSRPPASDPEEGLRRLLLENEVLVIERQIEMLNIFVGFEQSNRYSISNEAGEHLGFIAEEPRGFLGSFSRQILRTHRPFRALVMDVHGSPILWIRRPFAWINSRMFVQRLKDYNAYTPGGEPVLDTFAEVQQRWHIWRRRYDLFLRDTSRRVLSLASEPQPEPSPDTESDSYSQYARVDEGLLAWNFSLRDANSRELGHIGRAFRGFGRELFTDTGQYLVRFGPRPIDDPNLPEVFRQGKILNEMSLDQRALVLALAVNIDFDYFSRHSEGGGMGTGGMWIWTMGE